MGRRTRGRYLRGCVTLTASQIADAVPAEITRWGQHDEDVSLAIVMRQRLH